MSLWTPGGEHEVPRENPANAPMPGAPDLEDLTDEERAQAEQIAAELAEARARLAETPAAVVIANHVMGFYELGAIHLSQDPPNLGEAHTAIDAMGAVMDKLEGRLGENEPVLREARSQLQMVFVELSKPPGTAPAAEAPGEDPAEQ